MRVVYSLAVAISTPFILLYFLLRGFRDRDYLQRWRERFGYVPYPAKPGGIWVHAASVGEFNAATPLIRSLLESYPDLPVMVTTLTPTGSERVKHVFGDRVFHCYIPIDLPVAVSRFLDRLQPRLIIVMETEIWPNLYLQAQRVNIPLVIANARLSKRSLKHFQYLPGFVGRVLQSVTWMGAQSTDDKDRLVLCGADKHRTKTTGNLKFDLDVPSGLEENSAVLRSRWGKHRPVLVAGSTHETDEQMVIPAFSQLLQEFPDALLILVPRHPERFTRSAQLAKDAGLKTELRSQGESCSEHAQCFVIDSMGELLTYYACADVTYVGGSMGDVGGHNALEPAALGKPVLMGPNMDNARDIASLLLASNAALQVSNQEEFLQAAEKLLTNDGLRDSMGGTGQDLVEKNRGALNLTLEAIEGLLKTQQAITPEDMDTVIPG